MIDYFGRTREEFIDFITDMLILKEDNIMANTILDEYFNVQHNNWESREDIWELRTDILEILKTICSKHQPKFITKIYKIN